MSQNETPQSLDMQDNDTKKVCNLKRCAHDIACESYEEEDKICALVSSHVRPEADEDWGVRIG